LKTKVSRSQQQSVFKSLLVSMLVPCLLATLLLGLVFVPMMHGSAKRNDEANARVILDSVANRMDSLVESFDAAQAVVEVNDWIQSIFLNQLVGKDAGASYREAIPRELGNFCIRNGYKHFSFMLDGNSALYTNKGVFSNGSAMLETYGTLEYEFFYTNSQQPVLSTLIRDTGEYLLYQTRFRVNQSGQYRGVINILISTDSMVRDFTRSRGADAAAFRITDPQGKTLWQFTVREDEEETVTLSRASENGKFVFCVDIPESEYYRIRSRTAPVIALTMVIVLLSAMAACYVMSRINYRPIRQIVWKFVGQGPITDNDFQVLEQVFDGILEEKSIADSSLEYLRPMAQQKVLGELLDGTSFLGEASEEALENCGVRFPYKQFNVIALEAPFARLTGSEYAAELATEVLLESLKHQTTVLSYLYIGTGNHYRLIVNYDSWEQLQSYISHLMGETKKFFAGKSIHKGIYIGVGQPVSAAESLYHAADQADTAIYMAVLNQLDQPMFYRELAPEMNYDYYYPMSEELMLSRAITNCNSAGAKSLLYAIINENKRNVKLNPQCLQLLYMDLSSTVARSGQSLNVKTLPVNSKETYLSLDEICERVESMIDHICGQLLERRNKAINPKEQEILEYIDEHIFEPSLSLSSVGEKFQRSSSYISNLFKEYRDTNFNNYINRARILRAIQLMAEEGLDSNTVYPMVGYTNLTTFRRNFTKFAKHNPGEAVPQDDAGDLN